MTPDRQFPLAWPMGWKRTASPGASSFRTEPGRSTKLLMAEIDRLGGRDVIISSNAKYRQDGMPYAQQVRIEDTGIAVYFKRKGKDMVFACDSYWTIHENIHAIAKTIEALRAIERHGASNMMERAFTGFTALPAPIVAGMKRPWREVLGFPADAVPFPSGGRTCSTVIDANDVRQRYRALAFDLHPDHGGTDSQMAELNTARDEALKELG